MADIPILCVDSFGYKSDSVPRRYKIIRECEERREAFLSATAEQLAKIEELSFSCCLRFKILKNSLWRNLYAQLRLCHNLHSLSLSMNDMDRIEQNKILELFQVIAKCPIVRLDLSNNYIAKAPTELIKTIFAGIGLIKHLGYLDISQNYMYNLTVELREYFYNIIVNLPSLHKIQL